MPFKEPYDSLYKKIWRPCLSDAGFKVVRVDEIQKSSDISDDIAREIANADLVVIEASESNQNVYFEFGLAASHSKELVILATKGTELPFDTRQWRHLFYDPEDIESLKASFRGWIERTAAYQRLSPQESITRLERGELLPDIVDATLYIATTNEPIDKRILKDINSVNLIPCSYSYYTDVGTDSWLDLCQDPLYKIFGNSLETLASNAERILSVMDKAFIDSSPDFVSLGPGNGQKDRILLRCLVERLVAAGLAPDLYYYPIDISPRMLSTAVKAVSGDQVLADQLKIKVAEGEFENLSAFKPIFDFRAAPNLFVFLGNTLGNVANEIELLLRIKNAMQPGDVLIIEVRLKSSSIELGGDEEHQFMLSFAPLKRLGVSFDRENLQVRNNRSLSQIQNTATVSVHYVDAEIQGKKIPDITLSCVNHYDRNSMKSALLATPLEFKMLDVIETDLLALYVLEKS